VELLVAGAGIAHAASTFDQATENTGLVINLFWVIIAAVNFIVFLLIIWRFFFGPVGRTLEQRRERIEQGLKDADAARRDRESAAEQRNQLLADARKEAAEILARADRQAEEARTQGLTETRTEIDRLREQAVSEIDAERQRALADVRAQVADLALLAAGKVVGETMSDERQRRLVDQFLSEVGSGGAAAGQAGKS
jgi:F-type H+-transporting ATPase subunit b